MEKITLDADLYVRRAKPECSFEHGKTWASAEMTETECRAAEQRDPPKTYVELEVKVPWRQSHAMYCHVLAFCIFLLVLWKCIEIYPLIPEAPKGLPVDYFTQD